MLDLSQTQLAAIQQILKTILPPGSETYAYGSRVKNNARQFSDLDLVIKSKSEISAATKEVLEEAFSDSDLPFSVDISNWGDMSRDFRNQIEKDLVKIALK